MRLFKGLAARRRQEGEGSSPGPLPEFGLNFARVQNDVRTGIQPWRSDGTSIRRAPISDRMVWRLVRIELPATRRIALRRRGNRRMRTAATAAARVGTLSSIGSRSMLERLAALESSWQLPSAEARAQ